MFQNIASLPDMKMLYYHRQHLSWDWVIAEDIYSYVSNKTLYYDYSIPGLYI